MNIEMQLIIGTMFCCVIYSCFCIYHIIKHEGRITELEFKLKKT